MDVANVYRNHEPAGRLIRTDEGTYVFRYSDAYYYDANMPSISLTLSKSQQEYTSKTLFPFFSNMLSEGANRRLQCRQLRIDENDSFSLLLGTGGIDTIGAVTVERAQP